MGSRGRISGSQRLKLVDIDKYMVKKFENGNHKLQLPQECNNIKQNPHQSDSLKLIVEQ